MLCSLEFLRLFFSTICFFYFFYCLPYERTSERSASMRASDCHIAVVALLPVLIHGLSPATNDHDWIYRGCYSDKPYNIDESSSGPAHAVSPGVPDFPRTLNGLFTRNLPSDSGGNGGRQCRSLCAANQFRFAGTNNDQCWCDNAIAINGTSAASPKFGLPDDDDTFCQTPCAGNSEEACGNNSRIGDSQRLSMYEMSVQEWPSTTRLDTHLPLEADPVGPAIVNSAIQISTARFSVLSSHKSLATSGVAGSSGQVLLASFARRAEVRPRILTPHGKRCALQT